MLITLSPAPQGMEKLIPTAQITSDSIAKGVDAGSFHENEIKGQCDTANSQESVNRVNPKLHCTQIVLYTTDTAELQAFFATRNHWMLLSCCPRR